METDNNPTENIIHSKSNENSIKSPFNVDSNQKFSDEPSMTAPAVEASQKLVNPLLISVNNPNQFEYIKKQYEPQRMPSVISADQNHMEPSGFVQTLPIVSYAQNYLINNSYAPQTQGDNVYMHNNCYYMRMPSNHTVSEPQRSIAEYSQAFQTSNQGQATFQTSPNIIATQFNTNQQIPGHLIPQNYISQPVQHSDGQGFQISSGPRVGTPVNVSSPAPQEGSMTQQLPFVVQAQNQANPLVFQMKSEQAGEVASSGGISTPQIASQTQGSNATATPINVIPQVVGGQGTFSMDQISLQSKIAMVVNQISQLQANINSLGNANNPQALQLYQFLTGRLQQLRTIYCQLTLQQQQMQQRNMMFPVQQNLPPQLSNNPNALAMLQQQIALQNQLQSGMPMNQMIPRANIIQASPYQLRMNQPVGSMMPPGLVRFAGPRPGYVGPPGFMGPSAQQRMPTSEPLRNRRSARGSRRRRKFSSESEEEEEITSSDVDSASQLSPSRIPLEESELRRSTRRTANAAKTYMQEFPDESDTDEKSKKDTDSVFGNIPDLIPFQPLDQGEGKMMLIEKILADRIRPAEESDDQSIIVDNNVEEYYVKFKYFSYLHCEWCSSGVLRKRDRNALSKIKRYKMRKRDSPFLYIDEDPFNPDYTEIDRVLDCKSTTDPSNPDQQVLCYLVKWCALPYDESTWEFEEEVDELSISEYKQRNTMPPNELLAYKQRPSQFQWQQITKSPVYKNSNMLRDYQLEGINWLLYEYYSGINCILADEMGLGKTIQSIAFLIEVRRAGIRGPFLIIAPLSTIGNWYREFQSWSDFNVVVFHGTASSRSIIHRYELYYRNEQNEVIPDICKFEVLITTYEMILSENKFLSSVRWRIAIVDEAHRLKNRKCKLLGNLSNIYIEHRVLLTGTPLQNTLDELLSLLNFLDPGRAENLEAVIQQSSSGRLETNQQVQQIQAFLKPVILRRLKEDVEKNIAPKEETIIEVEMTTIQKKVYRGVLERNLSFLTKGVSTSNFPNLMNIMMELRKCCNHPFLINGVEEKILAEYTSANLNLDRQTAFRKSLVESSGKMVLIDKLLPKLRENGHKMLVFSQMVRVLDLIEEYLVANGFLFERIDGSVRGNLRQAAIDRFSKPDSDRSVFLLCTKAGGLGINLTAADIVIIFDSDWNPQNDIQAQARCHRIGQNKAVKVYRLICRKTYEREMFDRASMKLGLDRAVLQDINSSAADSKNQLSSTRSTLSKKEVEELLRRGAYAAVMDEDIDASAKFCSEDIEQILERRATVIQIAGEAKGSTFAKASFNADVAGEQVDIDDPDFWQKWAKSAKVTEKKESDFIDDKPRIRKQVRSLDDDSDVEYGDLISEHEVNRRSHMQPKRTSWLKKECLRVEKYLLIFGWNRWADILKNGGFKSNMTVYDVEQISKTILIITWHVCRSSDHSFTDFVEKAIRLTTLKQRHNEFDSEDFNYRPYSKRTRGKKYHSNRKRGDKMKICLVQATSDWKNIEIDALVFDSNYKKHLLHCSSKILIRLRLLFYIEYYILRDCKEDVLLGVQINDIAVPLVPASQNNLTLPPWWDAICDKSLVVGTFKHGYEKYALMKTDRQLCFFKHIDDARLSGEYGDSIIKRRGRKKRPTPPLISDDEAIENQLYSQDKKTDESTQLDSSKSSNDTMPTQGDLNTYLKRLITAYWKNRSKTHAKGEGKLSDVKSKWTRREEADFIKAVTCFGIQQAGSNVIWDGFRQLGRFERKDDKMMNAYFESLINRCHALLSSEKQSLSNGADNLTLTDGQLTLEKAERILQKVELFDVVRAALESPQLEEIIPTAPTTSDLPDWWRTEHDIDLLKGSSMFGIDHTDRRIFDEPSLSFSKVVEQIHQSFIQSSSEPVPGVNDVAESKDLGLEVIKSIIRWPKPKTIISRLYRLASLVTKGVWCDRPDERPYYTPKSLKKISESSEPAHQPSIGHSRDLSQASLPLSSKSLSSSKIDQEAVQ